MKRISKAILPLILIVAIAFGMVPLQTLAAGGPEISVGPTSEIEPTDPISPNNSGSGTSTPTADGGPEITVTPNEGLDIPDSSSSAPDKSGESTIYYDENDEADEDNIETENEDSEQEDGEEDENNGLEGATVYIDNGVTARMSSAMAAAASTGTLHITRYEQYQWNFGYPFSNMDMRPWYVMDIDGRPAYCVEPLNPLTSSGTYETLDYYSDLSGAQRLAVGHAMLYGSQDLSNPLYHMATQTIIWEITLGYMDLTTLTTINKSAYNATIGYNSGAAGYYDQIITNMRNHQQVPSFTRFVEAFAPLHNVPGVPGEYKLDLVNTNPNARLADFTFNNTGSVRFAKDGETLHVSSTQPLNGNTSYYGVKGSMDALNNLIFWCSGPDQIRATGHADPVTAYFRLITEDLGSYKITVAKLESGTNIPLSGAEFEVRHSVNGVVGTFTTDGSGRFIASVPWQGTYIVTEITPPKNHLLSDDPVKDIVISTDKPTGTLTYHNEKYSGIAITKVDATTKARIPGVTFRISWNGGMQHTDVVTGSSGIATAPNLQPGFYTIREISTPPGYILDTTERTVEIKSDAVTEVTIENYAKPSLEIRKVDANTGSALVGAIFRIAKDGGMDYKDITAGSDGIARLTGMDPGHYTVTEIKAPTGYLLNDQPQTVEIVAGKVTTLTVQNTPRPGLEIQKIDSATRQPLSGAIFRIAKDGGMEFKDITSDINGVAKLTGMEPGHYTVTEITAPTGYILNNQPQTIEIIAGKITSITIENTLKPGLEIRKVDASTGAPLIGASFRIAKDGGMEYQDVTTGNGGIAKLTGMEPGHYTVTEIKAPTGYLLDDQPRTVEIVAGKITSITIQNTPRPGLEIQKIDSATRQPLSGAIFRIAKDGGMEYKDITSDINGIAKLTGMDPGFYTVTEITAPTGYILNDAPQTIEIIAGKVTSITIENTLKPGLEIQKVDADTGAPLIGASFRIAKDGGMDYQDITTSNGGIARLTGMDPGYYTITEITAPSGYILNDQPQTVEIIAGQVTTITIENSKKPGLGIMKVDSLTGEPLSGASFRISKNGGLEYKDIVSGIDGVARLTGMDPGYYTITEILAPEGYILDDTPRTVEIVGGKVTTVTIENGRKPGIEILKIDSITKQPLQYATFKLSYKNGETIGTFTSDEDGRIFLEAIDPGLLVIEEITAPDGYEVINSPMEVLLKAGESKSVTFENTPKSPVIIKKIDSKTGEPLAGAKFRLTKMNGELIGEFTTGRYGYITIPELEPGWYTVVELLAPDGYKIINAPMNVQLKLGTPAIVEFENTKLPDLRIKKVDSITGEGLAGVEFTLTALDGRRLGSYTTDENGFIFISAIDEETVVVRETKTLPGYEIDTEEKTVQLVLGEVTEVEFTNTPLPGLLLQKLDSVTGLGMEGVEFEISTPEGKSLGKFESGENGYIYIEHLKERTIIIKETATLPGYRIDTAEKTIHLEDGVLNKVYFTNSPWPYLVIQKIDEGTGNPLPDAEFKLMDSLGREIGTYKTNQQGKIVLTGMDAGLYKIQETKAPVGYVLDDRVWDITLEWGKTTSVVFKNTPLEIEVTVEKRGPVEAIAGQEIQYDFRNISNKSTVALDDFYWHDLLPTDAVRLVSITTGTWNEDLMYQVVYRTNLKENWVVLADELITSVNHKLDCSAQMLGLASNEYVTEFKFLFGTVQPGFQEVKRPIVTCRVLADLPSEYTFTNRTDVGGTYGGKWVYDKDSWTTVVWSTPEDKGKLPKTGVWLLY